ncbi:MAG: DUF5605 domain-containing protein [Microbacteriaceae bacterium]|nr:DUF5605 domain-containing protein [Microbacteriaceae bacterium]
MGYSADSTVADALRDPAARAVVERHLPGALDAPLLRHLPLMQLGAVAHFSLFAGEEPRDLSTMWAELGALEGMPDAVGVQPEPVPAPGAIATGAPAQQATLRALGAAAPDGFTQWGVVEAALTGPGSGNPFTEVELAAAFAPAGAPSEEIVVGGFYDGDGAYLIRFQPPTAGDWSFVTRSNVDVLDGVRGRFVVASPAPGQHGPVRVADTFHFAHRDGTRFTPIGTTVYAWTHQGEELEERTLRALAASPFRKVRMCIFPKSYLYNTGEPPRLPYERRGDGFDFSRFDPAFFRHLERRILDLAALGVEADLILFHSYDRWGFSNMPAWADDHYLRYVTRRLAAFSNVWWSLANEYDLLRGKAEADWERFAVVVGAEDHVGHLMSIHNCFGFYDHSRPWVTHASIQRVDVYRTAENADDWRTQYGKPVVIDECAYEGDIDQGWGNISGQELIRRSWEGAVRGGYVTHGETYWNDREELWWSKGGELVGESPARYAFLARILAEAPGGVLEPLPSDWDARWAGTADHRIVYFGFERPRFRTLSMPPGTSWDVDVVDTWNMTVDTLPEPQHGRFVVQLPGREFMAVRLRRRAE